jgi:hypothetical protein
LIPGWTWGMSQNYNKNKQQFCRINNHHLTCLICLPMFSDHFIQTCGVSFHLPHLQHNKTTPPHTVKLNLFLLAHPCYMVRRHREVWVLVDVVLRGFVPKCSCMAKIASSKLRDSQLEVSFWLSHSFIFLLVPYESKV